MQPHKIEKGLTDINGCLLNRLAPKRKLNAEEFYKQSKVIDPPPSQLQMPKLWHNSRRYSF